MSTTIDRVRTFITDQRLIAPGDRILLSVSAGKDSMAMLHILSRLSEQGGFTLSLFHLNHLMRGDASDEDERFLQRLAARLGLSLHARRFDFRALRDPELSFEEQAREVRYRMLGEIATAGGYTAIATAHHRDDAAETTLLRVFQGSGMHGLRGIAPRRDRLIRPLLCLDRSEITSYCEANGLAWREDASNEDRTYLRNYIRHEIIPRLTPRFPALIRGITNLQANASDAEALLDDLIDRVYNPAITMEEGSVLLDPAPFAGDKRVFYHVVARILRERLAQWYTRSMLEEIHTAYNRQRSHALLYRSNKMTIRKTLRNGRPLISFSTAATEAPPCRDWEYTVPLPETGKREVMLAAINCCVLMKYVDYGYFLENKYRPDRIFVTIDGAIETITIRNRRKGDRMSFAEGTKKIKDIFIEKKLDNRAKDWIPLLIYNTEIIACMPGLIGLLTNRVAQNFLVTENSEKVLALEQKEYYGTK